MQEKRHFNRRLSIANLVISILVYIFCILFDVLYLKNNHKRELQWIRDMQDYPLFVEIVFWILSNLFFITILIWIIIFYLFVQDKPTCILVLTIVGMESFAKKFYALVYKDPRPFMIANFEKDKCFCVFGDPSGHISSTFNAYMIFIFFFILTKNINWFLKLITVIVYLFLIFLLGWSRLYETSHFINQLLNGFGQGYFYFSLFYIFYEFQIMKRMFNEHNVQYYVKDGYNDTEFYQQQNQEARQFYQQLDKYTIANKNFSDKKNQRIKLYFTIGIFLHFIIIFIASFILMYVRIETFEKKKDTFLNRSECGRKCQREAQEEQKYISYHGWASVNPFQYYLILLGYLYFNKKLVRVQNTKYFRQSFLPITKLLKRILSYAIVLIPIIINFIIIAIYGQTLITYLTTLPVFIVVGLSLIYIHVWIMKLLKCQIAGDVFYVPPDQYIEQKQFIYGNNLELAYQNGFQNNSQIMQFYNQLFFFKKSFSQLQNLNLKMIVKNDTTNIKIHKNETLPKLNIKKCRQNTIQENTVKISTQSKGLSITKDKRIQLRNSQKVFEILSNINTNSKSKINLEKRQNCLFNKVFIKPVKTQTLRRMQNQEQLENEDLVKYDEGVQKIKEVTKKTKNYLIYDLIAKKNKKNNNKDKVCDKEFQTLQQPQVQNQTDNLQRSQSEYFNEQISLEIPNLLTCEKNQTDILGISDNTITKKILNGFAKDRQIPHLNTNFLTQQRHHEKQLIFYQALLAENRQKYNKAIQYYKKFLQYVTRFNRELLIGYCFNKLGVNYYNLKKYEVSMDFHQKCIEYQSEEKQIVSHYNIGLALRQLDKIDEANQMFEKCLEFASQQKVIQQGLKTESYFYDIAWHMLKFIMQLSKFLRYFERYLKRRHIK